ncbi:XRE family transcriptional regulator [Luteimonas weifangensis]|uniref:XRE family transcriptional regulator n=1 Tax=Cognatiluteimonas weifangensis TaxID=2303539 RepID=A0A372DIQ1_9GAMM|nr:XRE family transcriptional regulator [Luteimonas weifangensis]
MGEALRFCRERRELSLREAGLLADVDHAYIHRLETGQKESPSAEVLERLTRVLKPSDRDAEMLAYLLDHPCGDAALVRYVLENPSIPIETFEVAYGVRHRGATRPEPRVLIERAQRVIDADDG